MVPLRLCSLACPRAAHAAVHIYHAWRKTCCACMCAAPACMHACVRAQIKWRLSDDPVTAGTDPEHADPAFRAQTRCMIFLGFTSNLTSAGVREHIRCAAPRGMHGMHGMQHGRASGLQRQPGMHGCACAHACRRHAANGVALLVGRCAWRRYLVQHRMVDVLVSTAGGIEEDFIKCMAHTYTGDFALKGGWRWAARGLSCGHTTRPAAPT